MRTDPNLIEKNPIAPHDITLNPQSKDQELWQKYLDAKKETPMLFPTEGAKRFGVSEFQLLLASPESRYLGGACAEMLMELESLGVMENIVRNEFAVHEKLGAFSNLKIGPQFGLAVNEGGLDLRIFIKRWAHMLAVVNPERQSYSIQFYDNLGQAVSKAFVQDKSPENLARFQALCDKYANQAQASITLQSIVPQSDWHYHQLSAEQQSAFQNDWRNLKDIHDFHGVLSQYKLDRASSYHQAPEGMSKALQPSVIEVLFEHLAEKEIPVMIFVGNTGMVQIQTGTVKTLKRASGWFNILDHDHNGFNLHLHDEALKQVWWVKRPSVDGGFTTAIEGFDKYGNSIITLFGERHEGSEQCPRWNTLLDELCQLFEKKEGA
ncbi:MAG: ChuX/HutX family heme-like substrate-binding protein [Cardiobacteriaceae bacterium]|nr:ChuX/HutX family heme-like substrate-binding protein [Cardiobacteriaceae bacterium]